MRIALAAVLIVALSGAAAAQSRASRPGRSTDELQKPSIGLPLPQIGLPLPPIGLPLPSFDLPPLTVQPSEGLNRSAPTERSGRIDRRRGSVAFFVPTFGWPYAYPAGAALPGRLSPSLPARATGRLHLDLQSGIDPQIYVDGYYVGLLSDSGGELTIDTGPHVIELRDDGFETLRVDMQIPVDGLITYRGDLRPADRIDLGPGGGQSRQSVTSPDAAAQPEVPPTTIYVIPGCYVGNVPPGDAFLPAGCNADRAVVFPSRP